MHINSGIPNHAFYLLAAALGGNAWEQAGQIWYDTLTGGELSADAQFADFAAATVAAARARYGEGDAEPGGASPPGPRSASPRRPRRLPAASSRAEPPRRCERARCVSR